MQTAADAAHNDLVLEEERAYHNRAYSDSTPFGFPSLAFTKEQVWRHHDHAYKPGTHIKGYRTRLLFNLLDLDHIAGKKILDVGCGNGQFAVFFAMYGAEVWGIDISDVGIDVANRIAQANNVAGSCHFIAGDVSKMEFEDDKFDIVVMNAVLHHTIKYPRQKEEMIRVLKPGGYLAFADIIRDNKIFTFCKSVYLYFVPETDSGVNVTYADYMDFMKGFQNVSVERLSMFESIKLFFPRRLSRTAPVRGLIYAADRLDSALLRLFPGMRTYCLDIVGRMQKPV